MKTKSDCVIRKAMSEKRVNGVKLSERIDMPYASFRKALCEKRFPVAYLKKMEEELGLSREQMEKAGFQFYAGGRLRGRRSALSHKFEARRKHDILPVLKAIANSRVKSCSLEDIMKLLEFQDNLPTAINPSLAFELLTNIKNESP